MADLALNIVDRDDFAPDPSTRDEIEFDGSLEHIMCFFIRASRGDDIAWNISNGMLSIHTLNQRRSDLRPDARQRDRLLTEIGQAHAMAFLELPREYSRQQLAVGMNAVASIVARLAETDEQRASWNSDVVQDLHAYARMLRNDLHNISLAEEIDRRRLAKEHAKQGRQIAGVATVDLESPPNDRLGGVDAIRIAHAMNSVLIQRPGS